MNKTRLPGKGTQTIMASREMREESALDKTPGLRLAGWGEQGRTKMGGEEGKARPGLRGGCKAKGAIVRIGWPGLGKGQGGGGSCC